MSIRKWVGIVHPRVAVVFHDLLITALAWWVAKELRYAMDPQLPVTFGLLEFPIVLLVQGLIYAWTGLYKGVWRFASLPDLWNILRAAIVGTVAIGVALFLYGRLEGVPRSVLLLYPFVLALFLGTPRLAYRFWKDSRIDLFMNAKTQRVLDRRRGSRWLRRLRAILHRDSRYVVVGFVDDQRSLRGARINGKPVLGTLDQLPDVAKEAAVQMLLIALPGASAQANAASGGAVRSHRSAISHGAQAGGCRCRACSVQPDQGSVDRGSARPRRRRAGLDCAFAKRLTGRRVLVTGGGGSIGSELCRQVARLGVHALTIVESQRIQPLSNFAGIARGLSRAAAQQRACRLRRSHRHAPVVYRR